MSNQELIPKGGQPVQVVIPEGQAQQPVIHVTVNIQNSGGGGRGKTWLLILVMAFFAYDWYFNNWAYTNQARDFIMSKTAQVVAYNPPDPVIKGVDYRLVKVITRAQELAPFSFEVRECIRSQARQNQLVKAGFSWTTNSYHKTGHACDIGKPGVHPTDNKNSWKWAREINTYMQRAAKEQGVKITWGGDWKGTPDGFHWQVQRSTFVPQPKTVTKQPSVSWIPKPKPRCVLSKYADTKQILAYTECMGANAGLPKGYMAVKAVLESGGNQTATNKGSGAQGLYQFLPETAKEQGVTNAYNVVDATKGAIKYTKTFTASQDPVILYMQHNQGVCGYEIIRSFATHGTHNMRCGGVIHSNSKLYAAIRANTNGKYKRTIRWQGVLNKKSAQAYIDFMTKTYWPKGVRRWKQIMSQ